MLKDRINLETESKSNVVNPADKPVLEIVEAVSNTTSIKVTLLLLLLFWLI
jgi:hypothetical protein